MKLGVLTVSLSGVSLEDGNEVLERPGGTDWRSAVVVSRVMQLKAC